MTAPRRRWFSFSLRSLFAAVTVLACWLSYQLNWIRRRDEMIANPPSGFSSYESSAENGLAYTPLSLRPFGVKPIYSFTTLDNVDLDTKQRIQTLFPESLVFRRPPLLEELLPESEFPGPKDSPTTQPDRPE